MGHELQKINAKFHKSSDIESPHIHKAHPIKNETGNSLALKTGHFLFVGAKCSLETSWAFDEYANSCK